VLERKKYAKIHEETREEEERIYEMGFHSERSMFMKEGRHDEN